MQVHAPGWGSLRKTGHVPARADAAKQKTFLTDTPEGLMCRSLAGERRLSFMDASHFVLGAFLGMLWCFSRVFIPSGAGRNRTNVLSALGMAGLGAETVVNTTCINAETVIEPLGLLAQKYLGAWCLTMPVISIARRSGRRRRLRGLRWVLRRIIGHW